MTDARLQYPGGRMRLSVRQCVEGPHGLVVSALAATSAHVAFDPGLANAAMCTSAIMYVDEERVR